MSESKLAYSTGYAGTEYDSVYHKNLFNVVRMSLALYELNKEIPLDIELAGVDDIRELSYDDFESMIYLNDYIDVILRKLGLGILSTSSEALHNDLKLRYETEKDKEELQAFWEDGDILENNTFGISIYFNPNEVIPDPDNRDSFHKTFDSFIESLAVGVEAGTKRTYTLSDGSKIYLIEYQNDFEIMEAFDDFIMMIREFYTITSEQERESEK